MFVEEYKEFSPMQQVEVMSFTSKRVLLIFER